MQLLNHENIVQFYFADVIPGGIITTNTFALITFYSSYIIILV